MCLFVLVADWRYLLTSSAMYVQTNNLVIMAFDLTVILWLLFITNHVG